MILPGTHLNTNVRFDTFHDSSILDYSPHDSSHNLDEISPTKKGKEKGVAAKNGSETSSS